MSDELEPCPFCGGNARIETNFGREWFVYCDTQKCEGNKLVYQNEHEAIAAWNHRVSEADHWRVKAECYGNIVHGCSPALEAAGFPVDSSMPEGAIGGIKKAVEALAADRDRLQAEIRILEAEIVDLKATANSLGKDALTHRKENLYLKVEIAGLRRGRLRSLPCGCENRMWNCEKHEAIRQENEKLQREDYAEYERRLLENLQKEDAEMLQELWDLRRENTDLKTEIERLKEKMK